MTVHFSSSLWSREKGARGIAQKTGWRFEHRGLVRHIPCVYRFRQGIVFDVLTLLDEGELRAYFDKYAEAGQRLTPMERRCARQDHPFRELDIGEIWIDAVKITGGFSASSAADVPFERENRQLAPVRRAYRRALEGASCFGCQRFCVPYPQPRPASSRLLWALGLDRVRSLGLVTRERHRFYPLDCSFELGPGEGERAVSWVHPATGEPYTLHVQPGQIHEIPRGALGEQPLWAMSAGYEAEPPLPPGDRLQFDSSISHPSRRDGAAGAAASAIGIIGGADGPTAVVMSGKSHDAPPLGPRGLPVQPCFSVIALEPGSKARFVIEGLYRKTGGKQRYDLGNS